MKHLLLMRHAKSSWDDPSLADHDRPLTARGGKAALRMGRLLRDHDLRPDLILCSTAARARETLRLVLEESRLKPRIEYLEQLFHCSPDGFAAALRMSGADFGTVMLIGHNPGMEEFLYQLTGQFEEFPTAALARLKLDLKDWSQFNETIRGQLQDLWRPKQLDSES